MKREKDEGRKGVYTIYTVSKGDWSLVLRLRATLIRSGFLSTLLQLALVQWRDHYFKPLHARGNLLMKAVLQQIENQRNGEDIDTGLIKKVVDSMVALGSEDVDPSSTTITSARVNLDVYRSTFQDDFLRSTENYYRTETENFLANNSVSDYLKKAEQRLEEEDNRVDRYLHSSTKRPVSDRTSPGFSSHTLTSGLR